MQNIVSGPEEPPITTALRVRVPAAPARSREPREHAWFPGPSRTSVNEHQRTALTCDTSKSCRSGHDRYDLDTVEVITRTKIGRRPDGLPPAGAVGFRTGVICYDL